MLMACVAQFMILGFDIKKQIPTEADRKAGEALVQRLKRIDGDVLIPAHGYLAHQAGKAMFAHEIALLEVQGEFSEGGFIRNPEFEASLRNEIAVRRFSAVILDGEPQMWQPVFDTYESEPLAYPDDRTFLPITGMRTRPNVWWTPP